MKKIGKIIRELFSDSHGNLSMMRVAVFASILITAIMMMDLRKAFYIEIQKENPDYQGFALLCTAIIVNFALPLLTKALQKKYEESDDSWYYPDDDGVYTEDNSNDIREDRYTDHT